MDAKTLLLKPMEVAEQLRISRAKTYMLIETKEIPSIKVGGSIRVSTAALHEWIARQAAE